MKRVKFVCHELNGFWAIFPCLLGCDDYEGTTIAIAWLKWGIGVTIK